MAKDIRKKELDLSSTPPQRGEMLYNKFLYANITIINPEGKPVRRMSLIKLRGDLTFTGTLNKQIGNATVKGTVTFYTNLSGYDSNTSLLAQIKEAIGDTELGGKDKSQITMEVFCGYLSMPGSPYGFAGNVIRIKSEKDMGMKTQAWQIEFVDVAVYSNTFNLIWEKPTRKYSSLNVKEPLVPDDAAEGKSKGATYLQILTDIYTPKDSKLSFLDNNSTSLRISYPLKELLNQQIVWKEDTKGNVISDGTFLLNYSSYSSKSNKRYDSFGAILRDFWVKVKRDLDLGNLFLTTLYRPDSLGVTRAYLSLSDQEYRQKIYAYLDDSKIIGSPYLAANAFFEIETVFDPSIFSRDGVIIKSRYFNIFSSPYTSGLNESNNNDIIIRKLTQEGEEVKLPIWYIISYTVRFSNVNSEPATMVLSLSRDLPPFLVG